MSDEISELKDRLKNITDLYNGAMGRNREQRGEIDYLQAENAQIRLDQEWPVVKQLGIAVIALKAISHPSVWLDDGSDGVLRIAEEALKKIREIK